MTTPSTHYLFVPENDAPALLKELDLSVDLLLGAVHVGHAARANTGMNHPRTAPGYFAWAELCAGLSERLIAEGWTRKDVDNIPVLIHPNGSYQIVVSSGDAATGTPLESVLPSTAREKGAKFSSLFGGNSRDLFDPPVVGPLLKKKIEGECPVWILLYYYCDKTKSTRAELSLPKAVDPRIATIKEKNHIADWNTRVILGTVGGEPEFSPGKPEFTDETDFDVVPRQNR